MYKCKSDNTTNFRSITNPEDLFDGIKSGKTPLRDAKNL